MTAISAAVAVEDEDDRNRSRSDWEAAPAERVLPFWWSVALIAVALTPRLLYLFIFSDPQNAGDGMTDTYHHWQIGYLTSQIGLSQGWRLWDLKGLEYFWGLLHPMLLVILFFITGSIDIVIPRLLGGACGVLSVVLVFRLCWRYWTLPVATTSAAFAALAPFGVFNDTLGMVEPIAVALCLLGLWWFPRRGFLAGAAWGLSAMARTEAWLFTLGLIVAACLRRSRRGAHIPLIAGWVLVIGIYMKILLTRTGNPIYPLYEEYAVEVTGKWLSPTTTAHQHSLQAIFAVMAAAGAIGLVVTLWKRPSSHLFLTYGFGSSAFVIGLLAFTPFLTSWSGWVWRIRVLSFTYDFVAVLVAVVLFVGLPRVLKQGATIVAWGITGTLLIVTQLAWIPIQDAYRQTEPTWQTTLATARYLAVLHATPTLRGGAINIPADHPSLTYALARFGGVSGRQIVGQLYDAFYALPAGYRYVDHRSTATTLMQCWLSATKTSVFAVPRDRPDYVAFLADHQDWVSPLGTVSAYDWTVQAVHAPVPSSESCGQATREAVAGR